jgi:hypothetical protein
MQPKQPHSVKPPSNYGKANRQLSHNRIAPPQKAVEANQHLSRDKSSDAIVNRGLDQQQMLQNQA